jgi:hypothetical protein
LGWLELPPQPKNARPIANVLLDAHRMFFTVTLLWTDMAKRVIGTLET